MKGISKIANKLLLASAMLTAPIVAQINNFPTDCSWWHLSSTMRVNHRVHVRGHGHGHHQHHHQPHNVNKRSDSEYLISSCEIGDPANSGKVTGSLDLNTCIGVEQGNLVWQANGGAFGKGCGSCKLLQDEVTLQCKCVDPSSSNEAKVISTIKLDEQIYVQDDGHPAC